MWREPAPMPPLGVAPLREGAPMTPAEPVTDAHLHLWDLAASRYAWLAGAPEALRRTVDIDDVREGLEELDVTRVDRKSTRLNSSHVAISYAVFCLKKKKQ